MLQKNIIITSILRGQSNEEIVYRYRSVDSSVLEKEFFKYSHDIVEAVKQVMIQE